jgi:competence protein ComEC
MSILLISFSFGIIAAQFLPTQLPWCAEAGGLASALLLLGAFGFCLRNPSPSLCSKGKHLLFRKPIQISILLSLAFFSAGFAWSGWAAQVRLEDYLSADFDDKPIDVVGWIDDLTQTQSSGLRMTVAIDSNYSASGIPSRVSVTAPLALLSPSAHLSAGTCHRFTLRLRPVHGRLNFSGFDSTSWMWAAGIRASGKVLAVSHCTTQIVPLIMRLQRMRESIRSRLIQAVPHSNSQVCCSGILVALAVGDQSGVDQDQWSILWRTGVGHLVSISGVHVTLLASILRKLAERGWRFSSLACRLLPASRAGLAIGFIAALAYALVAGFAIPTQRTLYMLGAGWIFSGAGINAGAGRLFWCAVAMTLALNPFACLSPSFWLSYAAVGGLILADLGQFGIVPKWRSELKSQWVVNLALLPLVAVWFGQLSLIAPIANAIAIPWVGMLVTPLTLIAMFPHLSFFAIPAHYLMQTLMHILGYLAQPSWAAITITAPDTPSLWVSIAGILCLLIPLSIPHRQWAWLSLLPVCFPAHATPISGEARVEVLDIGQGLSVLIRTAHHTVLFDTGPRWQGGDAGQTTIVPILKSQGIFSLDQLILSHPDSDHVGGADSVAKAIAIQHTFTGFDHPNSVGCSQGQHWIWDQVQFEFLYPRPETPSSDSTRLSSRQRSHQRNNHACVLRVSSGQHSVLIPADIEAAAEEELVEESKSARVNLKSEVVVAAHHGSRTSSTENFIVASQARYVVFSAGWRNHFHHPHPDVIQRWNTSGASAYRTDQDGAVRITLNSANIHIETAQQARHNYWNN